MANESNGASHLLSSKNEFVKQHVILDAQGRPSVIIMAPVSARVGDPCPATVYSYVSAVDSTVINRMEGLTAWKQAYEDEYNILKATLAGL